MGKGMWITVIVILLVFVGGWALMKGKNVQTADSEKTTPSVDGNQQTAPATSGSVTGGVASDDELYGSSSESTDDGVALSDESLIDAP